MAKNKNEEDQVVTGILGFFEIFAIENISMKDHWDKVYPAIKSVRNKLVRKEEKEDMEDTETPIIKPQ